MAIIKAPNKDYSSYAASVKFTRGVGETTDKHLIEWFKSHGYTVEETETETDTELNKLTVKQLQEKADELELEYNSKTTKQALIDMITEAEGV